MPRAFVVGLLLGAALASCGGTTPRCLPSNCSGCCSADDVCVLTMSLQTCGRGGDACVVCAPDDECIAGSCIGFGGGSGGGIGGGSGGGDGGGVGGGVGGGTGGGVGGGTGGGVGGGTGGGVGGGVGGGTGGGVGGGTGGGVGGGGTGGGTGGGIDAGTGGGVGGGTGGGTGGGLSGPGRVLINEVDYDNIGTDNAEFIELYNPGTTAYSLTGVSVVLVNGANSGAYLSLPLSALGTLAPGEYVVIGATTVVAQLPVGVRSLTFSMAQDNVQNGAPDSVAVVSGASTVLDSLSYEGAMTWNTDAGMMLPMNEGPSDGGPEDSNAVQGSVARSPNGRDTDVNSADFQFVTVPTPGAANP